MRFLARLVLFPRGRIIDDRVYFRFSDATKYCSRSGEATAAAATAAATVSAAAARAEPYLGDHLTCLTRCFPRKTNTIKAHISFMISSQIISYSMSRWKDKNCWTRKNRQIYLRVGKTSWEDLVESREKTGNLKWSKYHQRLICIISLVRFIARISRFKEPF